MFLRQRSISALQAYTDISKPLLNKSFTLTSTQRSADTHALDILSTGTQRHIAGTEEQVQINA